MKMIRRATGADAEAIRDIHLSAFPEEEGERIARLALDLLSESASSPTLSLVAAVDAGIIGHVAFSPFTIDGRPSIAGYLLAPLAVQPNYQKQGIGSRLIAEGMERISETDACVVLVYGDPDYYRRFGFRTDEAESYLPPHDLKYPFGWQGVLLAGRQSANRPSTIRCVPSLCDAALW